MQVMESGHAQIETSSDFGGVFDAMSSTSGLIFSIGGIALNQSVGRSKIVVGCTPCPRRGSQPEFWFAYINAAVVH